MVFAKRWSDLPETLARHPFITLVAFAVTVFGLGLALGLGIGSSDPPVDSADSGELDPIGPTAAAFVGVDLPVSIVRTCADELPGHDELPNLRFRIEDPENPTCTLRVDEGVPTVCWRGWLCDATNRVIAGDDRTTFLAGTLRPYSIDLHREVCVQRQRNEGVAVEGCQSV